MTRVLQWAETQDMQSNDAYIDTERGLIYSTRMTLNIPARARILRMIASGGISAQDRTTSDTDYYAYPMVWAFKVQFDQTASARYPSGHVETIHRQAGPYAVTMNYRPTYDTTVSGTTVPFLGIPGEWVTNWHAQIAHVNQRMSYGRYGQDDGDLSLLADFDTLGYEVNSSRSDHKGIPWGITSLVFRALYEYDDGR